MIDLYFCEPQALSDRSDGKNLLDTIWVCPLEFVLIFSLIHFVLYVGTISCLFFHSEPGPAIEGVFGKDWCMDLWREEKLPPQRKIPMDPAPMTSMGPQVRFLFIL